MLKRHDDQIGARLDELYIKGSTYMSLAEIRHWYNMQRITKTIWNDIQSRWEDLLAGKDGTVYVDPKVREREGGIFFFFIEGAQDLSEIVSR